MKANVEAIRDLRERTGAGVMECRRALETSAGDMDAALAFIKEQGLLRAQKLQERPTSEGRVFVRSDATKGVVLRIGCETDFVARSKEFLRLGEKCLDAALARSDCEAELSQLVLEAASRTRESVVLSALRTVQAGPGERVFTYVHGEGKIGVAIVLEMRGPASWEHRALQALATDLTLHVAAFGPRYLSRAAVDSAYLELKKAEFLADAQSLGKPKRMIDPIAAGKLNKHLSQVCLLEQAYIRDETISVEAMLSGLRDGGGPEVAVKAFAYERVGT